METLLGACVRGAELHSPFTQRLSCPPFSSKSEEEQKEPRGSQVAAAVVRSGSFLVDNRAFLEVLRGVKARVADTQTNLKPVALATVAALVR